MIWGPLHGCGCRYVGNSQHLALCVSQAEIGPAGLEPYKGCRQDRPQGALWGVGDVSRCLAPPLRSAWLREPGSVAQPALRGCGHWLGALGAEKGTQQVWDACPTSSQPWRGSSITHITQLRPPGPFSPSPGRSCAMTSGLPSLPSPSLALRPQDLAWQPCSSNTRLLVVLHMLQAASHLGDFVPTCPLPVWRSHPPAPGYLGGTLRPWPP